jgi:poly [ADP-ribose] polymerase 2/3/4
MCACVHLDVGGGGGQGLLLLCEVALGAMRELTSSDSNAHQLPPGMHSTKGVGRTAPDPAATVTLPDGIVVPLGTPVDAAAALGRSLSLLYNEYIVYQVGQLRIRYILMVEFEYGRQRR